MDRSVGSVGLGMERTGLFNTSWTGSSLFTSGLAVQRFNGYHGS